MAVVARGAGALLLGCCIVCSASAQEGDAEAAPTSAAAGGQRLVDIFNYRIEGNSVLPQTEVERAVMPFLGPQRPVADVEAARAALEKAYRDGGFETVGVEIPEQDVRGGTVRLNVTELKVGRLRVTNARHFSPDDIREALPSLAEGRVPNYREVSREIAAANKSSERLIMPSLRAGDTPDTVDVDLQVEDQRPLHGSLEINDRFSSRTERLRVSASLRYANMFQLGHTLSVQGQVTPTDPGQSWSVSGSYVAPIAGSGFSVLGYAVKSNSDVSAVNGIGVLGTGEIYGARGLYSFSTGTGAGTVIHQLTAGIDYKIFEESLIVGADAARTPIDYFPATVQYSAAQRTERYDLDMTLSANFGLRSLGATNAEFGLKRFNASASWFALRTDIGYLHKLRGDWRLGVRLSGQIASGALISNEQFSAGGLDSVRGYFESQELGDDGASFQLQMDSPLLLSKQGPIDELRLFAFTDGAVLHLRDPLSSQQGKTSLLSVGAGANLRLLGNLNMSSLLAIPLKQTDGVKTDIADTVRIQVRAWAEF